MSKIYRALERVEEHRGGGGAAVLSHPGPSADSSRHTAPETPEYERLATAIAHAKVTSTFKSIMIASPDHGEGTSTVAAGLALSLARRGEQVVVLVEANFRSPVLGAMLHVEPSAGLAEVLAGQTSLAEAVVPTDATGVRLLAAGTPSASSARLLESARFTAVLEDLGSTADVIVVDGPPVLPYADALTIASKVDRVVVVTQADRTQRGHLERSKEELEKSGATILGVVLNRKSSHAPPWITRRFNL